jgi:hypothetical protein
MEVTDNEARKSPEMITVGWNLEITAHIIKLDSMAFHEEVEGHFHRSEFSTTCTYMIGHYVTSNLIIHTQETPIAPRVYALTSMLRTAISVSNHRRSPHPPNAFHSTPLHHLMTTMVTVPLPKSPHPLKPMLLQQIPLQTRLVTKFSFPTSSLISLVRGTFILERR